MAQVLTRANQVIFGTVLVVQMVFLVDGSSLFPSYWQRYGWGVWMPIYFALTAGALIGAVFFAGRAGIYGRSEGGGFSDPLGVFPLGLVYFAGGFVVALLIFQFPFLRVAPEAPAGDAFASTAFTIFVIAFTETLLLEWFFISFTWPVLKVWSAPASGFAAVAFHLAHYGGNLFDLLFIFLLFTVFGLAYVGTRQLGGMGLPWGSHAGWDMGTFGLVSIQFVVAAMAHVLRLFGG